MNFLKKSKLFFSKLSAAEAVSAALLLVQFLLIAYCNLALTDQNLDCDNAKMFKHIMTMWEHKTPVIPNWSNVSTMEWDCTTIFALPFYGLTKNIFLASGLSNILLTAMFIGILFFLFQGKEPIYPLVCANLLCIPYRAGMLDYYNMLFFCGAQYIVKVSIPLLLAGIILSVEKGRNAGQKMPKLWILFFILYAVLLLISSMSSGIYVAVCGLLPVCAAYLGYKLLRWERIPRGILPVFMLTIVFVWFGRRFNTAVLGGMRGESMVLSSAYHFFGNITACFTGVFELFGGVCERFDVAIFSLEGMAAFAKICLVFAMLACGVAAAARCVRGRGNLRMLLLTAVFAWNYLILSVSVTKAGSDTFEYRYHLIGVIPLACAACVVLVEGVKKLAQGQQRCVLLGGLAVLVFLNAASYRELSVRGEQNADLKEFVAYCEQIDVDYVYMYEESNNGDICRVLGRNNLYLCLGDDGSVWAYDYYSDFAGSFMQTADSIVAVRDSEYDFGEQFMILDYTLAKFDSIGERSLYRFVNE